MGEKMSPDGSEELSDHEIRNGLQNMAEGLKEAGEQLEELRDRVDRLEGRRP